MLGYLRIYKKENCLVESHNSMNPLKLDLSLGNPWPELENFVDSFNLDKLEKEQMLKVPWIVFILKAAKIWRASHNGLLPKNFKEKEEFKKLILDK